MIHPKDLGQPLPLHLQGVLTTEQERYDFFAAMEAQEAQMYAAKRINEYPPITDYLDGVVKGDQAQIDAYIAACQAVKNKYPKPE